MALVVSAFTSSVFTYFITYLAAPGSDLWPARIFGLGPNHEALRRQWTCKMHKEVGSVFVPFDAVCVVCVVEVSYYPVEYSQSI